MAILASSYTLPDIIAIQWEWWLIPRRDHLLLRNPGIENLWPICSSSQWCHGNQIYNMNGVDFPHLNHTMKRWSPLILLSLSLSLVYNKYYVLFVHTDCHKRCKVFCMRVHSSDFLGRIKNNSIFGAGMLFMHAMIGCELVNQNGTPWGYPTLNHVDLVDVHVQSQVRYST